MSYGVDAVGRRVYKGSVEAVSRFVTLAVPGYCLRGSRPERRRIAAGKEVRAQYPSGWKARTLWQKYDKLEKYARIW